MRYILIIAGTLLALSGCGSQPAPQNTVPQQQSNSPAAAWADVDPCELLPAEVVASYLGTQNAEGTRSDKFGRPTCAWTSGGSNKVKLMVWQPPAKDAIAHPSKKTLKVGDKTGYITTSTPSSCLLEVEAGTEFVSMDVFTTLGTNEGAVCQKVASTLTRVVDKLGW